MLTIISVLLWIVYLLSLYFVIFWLFVFLTHKRKIKKIKIKEWPVVSIIIPCYNEQDALYDTAKNALKIDYPQEKLEIIIVDDGSKDDTLKIARKIAKESNLVKVLTKKNGGKGSAMNYGIKHSKGEYIICFDSDSFVNPNALRKLLPYFSEKDIGVVLPAMKVIKAKTLIQQVQWYEYIVNMYYKELMGRLDCVHVAPGPFSVYRRDVLEEVGGFDEKRNLAEDFELTLRVQSFNYRIIQTLDTEVFTLAPADLKSWYKQRNRWFKGTAINMYKYRKLILNKKYNDFGMFQMPIIAISALMAITIITTAVYYTLKPYVEYFQKMAYIGYDFMTFIKTFKPSFNWLDYNYQMIFVAIIMLSISMFILIKAHKSLHEKLNNFKNSASPLLIFLFFYYLMISLTWLGVLFDLARGKVQKW